MYIKSLIIMIVFLQTAVSEGVVNELACEGEELYLRCPKGHTIEILSALFGKRNYKHCYQPGPQVENCAAENTLIIVKNKCNLRQHCRVRADIKLFGDPCQNAYKYLEVAYKCLKNNSIISIMTCQLDFMKITCPLDKEIKIVNAFYGRRKGRICPDNSIERPTLKCEENTTTTEILGVCDYYMDCRRTVNNIDFINFCPGTSKYLEVDYLCINAFNHWRSNVSCESEDKMILSCDRGYIKIQTAFFGNRNIDICRNYSAVNTAYCGATGTSDIMKFYCDYKRKCSVDVSTNVFGEPCPGVSKYLEVTYECVDEFWNTRNTCEHDKFQINCASGSFAWIVDAFFGKRDQLLCYKPDKPVVNNTCDANNAFDIVESRCQNKEQCTFDASVQVFGDPCCYSYKYLEVNYMCRDHKRLGIK